MHRAGRPLRLWPVIFSGLLAGILCSRTAGAAGETNGVLPYSVRVWQTDEGLPHNSVWAIAQTADGFLWVGTERGLVRFDGVRFVPVDKAGALELRHGNITALCAGRDGSLWVGCEGKGVTRLKHGTVSHLTESEGLLNNGVRCLLEDGDGALWVGTDGGLTRYRDGKVTNFTVRQALGDNQVRGFCRGPDDTLWVATRQGLSSLSNGRVTGTLAFGTNFDGNSLKCVCQDHQGRLWVGSKVGLNSAIGNERRFFGASLGLPEDTITSIYEDRAGQLWIGGYKGLVRMVNGSVAARPVGEAVFWDLVYTIFEDSEDNLWVGGRDGLYRLNPARFTPYSRQHGLSENNVMSVCQDRTGAMWIATWGGGLNRLSDDKISVYGLESGLTVDKLLALHEGRDGTLWIGTENPGGLNRFSHGFTNNFPRQSPTSPAIRAIVEDGHGVLWVGTSGGLNRWERGRMRNFTRGNGLAGDAVWVLCLDKKGELWVGTETGLSRREGNGFKSYTTQNGLSHNSINALYADADNTLWIGTRGGGLNRFKDGVFRAFTTRDGLFSDEVYEIVEDDYGFFWMTCRKGIFRVARKDLEEFGPGGRKVLPCTAFGKADGLLSEQFNGVAKPAGWKSRDGRLWFASIRGVVAVESRIKTNAKPPPVFIEDVLADRESVWSASPHVLDAREIPATFEVKPGRGDLEIHYAALSLQAPEKNRFKCILEPSDAGWNDVGTERVAHYNNLAPGTYRFHVMASNNDGVWNPEPVGVAIVLRPHFWQTWWFRTAIAAGIALLLTLAYRVRVARLRTIERLRVQIAANLHDDVGARLTKMAMVTEFADRETAAAAPAKRHLTVLSETTREIIQAMDEVVWTINPKNDTLDNLANYIFHYAQDYFQDTTVNCRLDLPLQLPDWTVSTESRHNLFMAVKEALNNVLKHSRATDVRITLETDDPWVSLTIHDNGQGFTPGDVRGGGDGLENMKRRLAQIGGRFALESEPGKGTTIRMQARSG